ncbi:response regulator [Arenibacterium sp. CAU 1754]
MSLAMEVTEPRPIRSVLIVDDHPLYCDALSMTLKTIIDFDDLRTASSLEEALALVETGGEPDLVVLDLNLPDVSGLDGLIRMKSAVEAPVIVVSSMSENTLVSSAIYAGAAGYVPKHSQCNVFNAAINALKKGETYLPAGYALQKRENDPVEDAINRLSTLTNQQARILQQICAGKLNRQIANDLAIAETTVKAHVTAIMRKLGVQRRTQAVLLAKKTSFESVLHDTPDEA